MIKILLLLLSATICLSLIGCTTQSGNSGSSLEPASSSSKSSSVTDEEDTFGNIIEFDGLSIVFGEDIQWTTLSNSHSEFDGSDVFAVPVSVINNNSEDYSLVLLRYSQLSPQGTKLSDISTYFDDSVDSTDKLGSGKTQLGYMYFLHDGDGDYNIEFENLSDKAEVKLSITKP